MKKVYVIDTNVLIQSPNAIENFEDNEVVIPLVVLEELDCLKKADGDKGANFVISLIVGAVGCISLGLVKNWLVFLVIYLIAKVGCSGSLIFYDSMLPIKVPSV